MHRSAFIAGGLAAAGTTVVRSAPRDVLRLAAAPLGHDIDPYRDAEFGVDELAWLYADGLMGWKNDRPVPLLAQDFPETSADGTVYRYHLREARWHDGRPLHARDVADAFAVLRDTTFGTRDPYARVRQIRVAGDRDIVVTLTAPYLGFVESFFGPFGVPAVPIIRHDRDREPIGTGPFAVRRGLDAQRWALHRWPASPRGAAQIERVDVTLVGTALTANLQILSGEADVALPIPPNVLGADRFKRLRRTTSTAVLLMNVEGLLRTVALRHAFAAVADVPALQRAYDRERRSLLASLLLEGPNDPALARALSFRPGLAGRLTSSIRDGELVLTYVAGAPAHERTMLLLQQNLRKAGVRSVLRPYPMTQYQVTTGPLRTGAFDVALYGFAYGSDPDLAADWSCTNRPPHGGNFARWCDRAFDRKIGREVIEGELRLLYDSLPFIPLSHAYEYVGVAPRVENFSLPGRPVPATYLCARWTLKS